jgi:hypothetical protein
MMRWRLSILLGAIFFTSLQAQTADKTALVIEYQHKMFYAEPGVTAAYSVDPATAQATAVPGGFQIVGTAPGQTSVIVVGTRGAHSILVTVIAPSKSGRAASGQSEPGESSSFGQYLISYNNNPNQITNVSDLTQISGDRTIHIQITNANIFPVQGESPVGFPILSYEIKWPRRSITFLDEMMHNSDLTIDGVLLRGFHASVGPWEVHGGITSVTQFQDFLLTGNRYEVGGISRHFVLNKSSSLEGNFYYIDTNTKLNAGATTGALGTLLYRYSNPGKLNVKLEGGAGNGFGFAGSAAWTGARQELNGDLRYESPNIATLGINQLHGRVGDFNWAGNFTKRSTSQIFASDTSINLPIEQQQISTINFNQTFWITQHIGAMGGYTVSTFASKTPAVLSVDSYGFSGGPELRWKRFGASYQYQDLANSGNIPSSSNQAITVQFAIKRSSVSGYYNEQSETPVFAPVQSSNPSLQEVLRQGGAQAMTPGQMGSFLRQDSSLFSQGVAQPVVMGIATRRTQYGGTVNWSGERAGRFSFNGMVNTSTGGTVPAMKMTSGGVTWTRQLGSTNLVNTGVSFFSTVSQGQSTTEPVIQVSLQHQLFSVPHWLAPGRHGTIEGHVFIDSQYRQAFAPTDQPLAGVLVRLDKHRSTRTDKNGYYSFRGVPFGTHAVEAEYRDSRPFFFTSGSPKEIAIGETADFGISFARGHLFGEVVNDAQAGLPVTLTVTGAGITRELETESDGQFSLAGLPDGDYTVHLADVSLPAGYFVGALEDSIVHVSAEHAGEVKIVVPAQRSIAGKVELYDPVAGRTIPLNQARVTIAPGGQVSTTDAMGRYLFRHLPPGTWKIVCDYEGQHFSRTVSLAPNPDIETGINFTIPLTGLASAPESAPTPASSSGGNSGDSLNFQRHAVPPRPKK